MAKFKVELTISFDVVAESEAEAEAYGHNYGESLRLEAGGEPDEITNFKVSEGRVQQYPIQHGLHATTIKWAVSSGQVRCTCGDRSPWGNLAEIEAWGEAHKHAVLSRGW